MPTNKSVVDVIEQWSGKRPEKMSQNLKDWWNQTAPGSTHSALAFDPDGIEDLVKRLQRAFPSSPALASGDFGDSGNVKTVQDLVDALQPVMADDVATRPKRVPKKVAKKTAGQRGKIRKGKKGRAGKKSRRRKKNSRTKRK
jgi:hypothetical protein